MNKSVSLLLSFLSFSFTLTAQKAIFHVNTGFALSQIDGDNLGGYKKLGYDFGAGFLMSKTETYEIDFSLRVNQKGASESGFRLASLNYAETDLSFNYIHNNTLYAGAGLGLGYLMNGENGRYVNRNLQLARLDLFPLVTIGYKATERISLQSRFTRSILPITQNGLTRGVTKWYNRSILLEVVWLFP